MYEGIGGDICLPFPCVNLGTTSYRDISLELEEVHVSPVAAIHCQGLPFTGHLGTPAQRHNIKVPEDPGEIVKLGLCDDHWAGNLLENDCIGKLRMDKVF